MNRRVLIALFVVFGAIAFGASPGSAVAATKTCHGKAATLVLSAPGTYIVDEDNAVVIGTSGADHITVNGSNPLVCSGAGKDIVFMNAGGKAYLGTGDDVATVRAGTVVYGESGNDTLVAISSTAIGGSGNDTLFANLGSEVKGGSGDDEISVNTGSNASGGSGQDKITVFSDAGTIDCGSNTDEITFLAPAESFRRCEIVHGT